MVRANEYKEKICIKNVQLDALKNRTMDQRLHSDDGDSETSYKALADVISDESSKNGMPSILEVSSVIIQTKLDW